MLLQREVVQTAMLAGLLLACSAGGTTDDVDGGQGGDGGRAGIPGGAGEGGVAGADPNAGGGGGGESGGAGNIAGGGGHAGSTNQTGTGGSGSGGSGTGGSSTGGSGSSTGGSGSGGSAVGGTGGTPVSVPCAQRPYCNDFENLNVGTKPAGTPDITDSNTLRVVNDKASSGTKSLYIAASSGAARFSFPIDDKLSNPRNVTYVRMMLWLDGLPGGAHPGHWDLAAVSGPARTSDGALFSTGVKFGGIQDHSSRLIYMGGGADCQKSAGEQALPLKKWTCVEMKVDETDAAKPYGVSVDGAAVPGLSMPAEDNGAFCVSIGMPFGTWYVPDGKTITIGWKYYHTQGRPVKLWIDDVIVDEKPIGCPH